MGCVKTSQQGWDRSSYYFCINWESTPWHTHAYPPMQRNTRWTPFKTYQTWNKVLREDKNMQLVYRGTELGTKFNVKDTTKKEHHQDLTYSVKCPMKNCL